MNKICNVCLSKDTVSIKRADRYRLIKCRKCLNYFISPFPSKEDTIELYAMDRINNAEYYSRTRMLDLKTFEDRIRTIKKVTGLKRGKILDYGCSTGNFMEIARKHKFDAVGKELNRKSIKICRQKKLRVDSKISDKDFDIVHAGDILEHMQYPRRFVRELGTYLKKDGYLIVSTPDFGHIVTRMTQVKPKEHLFYYTIKGAKYLLEKNGFEVIYAKGCKREWSIDTLLLGTTAENKYVRGILKFTKMIGLGSIFNWFISNLNINMLIVARKK